jgi:hypothetical protein
MLGVILGSTIGFWIGDRYGYPRLLRYGSYIGLTEIRIKIARYSSSRSRSSAGPIISKALRQPWHSSIHP